MIAYLVTRAGNAIIMGLSSDVKPASTTSLSFIETDTGTLYKSDGAGGWTATPGGGPGGASWGNISGTLSSQTDLQSALNAKANTSSLSTVATTGAYADLSGKPVLGTAAATNATDYATAAQGATADSALQPTGNGGALTGLTKGQVGLGNVDNTSDVNKPISTATQAALNAKQDTLVSATNIKTINGSSVLGSGNLVVSSGYHAVATLASNQATAANTTPVTLTGLSWSFAANSIYFFRWLGRVQPAAATTGCGFQLDVSAAVTEISMSFYHQLATAGTVTAGNSIADDASQSVTSGMPGTGTYPVNGMGMLRTGANAGTAQLRFRSETTAVTTALAGMTLVVEKVA